MAINRKDLPHNTEAEKAVLGAMLKLLILSAKKTSQIPILISLLKLPI